jgi:AcrR family transcriptional regulator
LLLFNQHKRRTDVKKPEKSEADCPANEPIDPRVRRTRKLLQDALRSLIHEKRFSKISVQDITERATVNRATFYAHYLDKEDLAASSLKADLHSTLAQRFAERPVLSQASLLEIAIGVFEFLGNMYDACPIAAAELQDAVGTAVQQGLYEMMDLCLAKSGAYIRLFPGCTRETVVTVLTWSIYGAAQRWSRSDSRAPAEQVCREIVSMLLPGQL